MLLYTKKVSKNGPKYVSTVLEMWGTYWFLIQHWWDCKMIKDFWKMVQKGIDLILKKNISLVPLMCLLNYNSEKLRKELQYTI